jgi:hypothetical protein
VVKALAGSLRKHVLSGDNLQMSGGAPRRPYKPWRLSRAFAWGLGVAILAQANHWLEIYRSFQSSSLVAASGDLIGRLDVVPVIFVLAAVVRNAVLRPRRAKI